MRKFHLTNNSIYIELYKVRYRSCDYIKVWIKYYSKSGKFLTEERSVKINLDIMKHWEVWND